jgi:hypothetical protein
MGTHTGKGRRRFVKQAVAGGGLFAAGVAGLATTGSAAAQTAPGDSPETILNLAATVETFVVTHLTNLLTRRTFAVTPLEELQARVLLASEQEHLNVINANGGRAAASQFFFPPDLYASRERFATVTAQLETACTAAYLAASRRFAELGNSRMAATQGQIACSEAQHVAVARDMLGVVPSDIAWAVPAFYNVSDMQPLLATFLRSDEGYTLQAGYPGADAVNALIGPEARRLLVVPPPFTAAF